MSALAQSIATSLGSAGGGYGAARDAQTDEKNQVTQATSAADQANFERSMRIKQFILEQQTQKRLADSAELQNRVQSALMAGSWTDTGAPVRMKGGGLGMIQHNSKTNETRVAALPEGTEPQNDDESKWDQYRSAYKQAFGKEPDDDLRKTFFNKMAGAPAPKDQTEFEAWREAFKAAHGKEPGAAEIADWHRAPKAEKGAKDDGTSDLGSFAQQLATKNLTLAQVPSKLRGPLLSYMHDQGMKLPNQLSPALEDKLMQRSDALQNTVDLIDQIRPDLDLIKTLPSASLVELAQSPESVKAALTRYFTWMQKPQDRMRIERLAGNLRSLQEAVNVIRGPLGATGFRGKEGWDALQNQTVRALSAPGVNAQVLDNTEKIAKSLLNSTHQVLGDSGEEATPSAASAKPSSSSDLHFDSKGNIIAAPAK